MRPREDRDRVPVLSIGTKGFGAGLVPGVESISLLRASATSLDSQAPVFTHLETLSSFLSLSFSYNLTATYPSMPGALRALCPDFRGVITGMRPYARYQRGSVRVA